MLPCTTRTGISGGIGDFPLPIPSGQIPYNGIVSTPMTEPVSPSDCVRWPNSPECGGTYFNPCGIPPSFWVETKCNSDGICCTYSYSTFLGYSPPPVITCYRVYGEPPKPTPNPGGQPLLPPMPDIPDIPDGCRLLVAIHGGLKYIDDGYELEGVGVSVEGYQLISLDPRSQNLQFIWHGIPDFGIPGIGGHAVGNVDLALSTGVSLAFGLGKIFLKPKQGEPDPKVALQAILRVLYAHPYHYTGRNGGEVAYIPWKIASLRIECPDGSAPYPIQPADNPPPQPIGEDPVSCCEESNALLREVLKRLGNPAAYGIPQSIAGKLIETPTITEIAYEFPRLLAERMGTGQFPVEIPATLLSDDKNQGSVKLESLTDFVGWFVQQVDALVGEFPIKIEIEDADAIKEGDQKKEISLPNLAEAIAELYGISFQSTYNSSLIVDLVLRNISEVIKFGNMGVETLDYAKAVAKHMGFKGNKVERKIPYFVDPREIKDLDKYRKEVELLTQGFEYEDKQTMAAQMKMILFAVSIIKAAFWEEWNPKRKYEAGKDIKKDAEGEDKSWDEHLTALRNIESPLRQDDDPPLKIREIPKPKK